MIPKPITYVILPGNQRVGVGPDSQLIFQKGSSRFSMGTFTQEDIRVLSSALHRLTEYFEPTKV